ncbi:hypothetical protein BBM40_16120 [Vibrio parahaemolyticus]|uniref:hypothetical protein n=1 Tax=Vibrio harveyi group TaxID=717610 RepID=UPI000720DEBC|nr:MULTISPECIES: hypothetical protein [Vibrio harveyi group]ALR91151.1 hypothetical protein AT730_01645 [Vibrio alginolyticus]MBY7707816.1 hypothetical protein [Vibrio alginolyticus]ODZ47867.1 hypothetical protein BBM40_16120 [Vibrio parahaemolyticus]HCG7966436.1 hypothetical protein [Vibrio parahaemolyticus]
MSVLLISEVDLHVVEEQFSNTKEVNAGFDIYDRTCFQITDGCSTAYAIIYDLFDECPELARFFVPQEYRHGGFGTSAAVSLLNHLFETKTQVLIDPVEESIGFWSKVEVAFDGGLDYEEIDGCKGIWKKI